MCLRCKKILVGKQIKYCSTRCKTSDAVARHRRKVKEKSVEYKGNKCMKCGYDKCIAALQFHHPNDNKDFGIADKGFTRSWQRVKDELDKCILICANCHAEEHWRVVQR